MITFDLTGKVAIVTGASSGLGRQFATALSEQGCDVAILANILNDGIQEILLFSIEFTIIQEITKFLQSLPSIYSNQ